MTIIAADWLLPISSAPIKKGAVAVENSQIIAVGAKNEVCDQFPDVQVRDFGEAAILPGFVNAHAHLELTVMRGFLDSVENNFFAWLRKLTAARLHFSAEDLFNSTLFGALEAVRAGVTCIGDIATNANLSLQALQQAGARGVSFQEVINPDINQAQMTFESLVEKTIDLRTRESSTVQIGVSPHAPYSVSPQLFKLVTNFALENALPVSIHAAESRSEKEFIEQGSGLFADFLAAREISWNAPKTSTIKYLNALGVLETSPLLAHCVNVDESDLELIAQTNTKIAHCPKSNAKFAHGVAPFAKFLTKNIKVGLGSDSVASNNTCDILEEGRFAALLGRAHDNFVSADEILRAATLGGAAALGLENEIGTLESGKQADLNVISLASPAQQPVFDVSAALVFASSARDVILTMIAGQTICENGMVKTIDEQRAHKQFKETAAKIFDRNGETK
jgi:5-methylthioadenosine/S-adenosylhomocysteine deaminase